MMKSKMKKNYKLIINVIIIIAVFAVMAFLLETDVLAKQRSLRSQLVPIAINIILAVSLNLVAGFLGELSLGHASFMAVGAYVSGMITTTLNVSAPLEIFLALVAGGAAAAVFGVIIGVPALRLKGDYLAIVTLACGEIIRCVLNALPFTGGAQGLKNIETHLNYKNWIVVTALVVITVILISTLVKSRHGRAICAVRDNYIAAESIGIKVSRIKLLAFVVGAFFAGIAGVIYAHNTRIVKPVDFDYNRSIEILVIVVLGGMGSIPGSIISAIILTLLPNLLRFSDKWRMLIYSIVLIVLMLFNESGMKKRYVDNGGFKGLIKFIGHKVFNKKKEVA